jgi:hypothetical protein
MNIRKLLDYYLFDDGRIKLFHLDIQNNTAEIELIVSRKTIENGSAPCTLRLTFQNLIEASIFDKFPMDGYYLEFRLYQNNGKEFGVFIEVYDNSSQMPEKHNWVIKSKRVSWKEV